MSSLNMTEEEAQQVGWVLGNAWKPREGNKFCVKSCLCRYDSFTGVPVCQQNISLEKASILFNMAALYTQIGIRSNRRTQAGLEDAIDALQKSAG